MTTPASPFSEPLELAARRLALHRVYRDVRGVDGVRRFMEHHAVCVLDFMSLVKRLQVEVTCTRTPWVPADDPASVRLINEIVLGEEADDAFGEEPASHYEWYLAAMDEVGADTGPVRDLEARLRDGEDPVAAATASRLPAASREFARTTFELAAGPLPIVAATFLYGREDVIPRMFLPLVSELAQSGAPCGLFQRYLERHIEVDGDLHGPLATRLFERTLRDAPELRAEAYGAALRALAAREQLWDATSLACREATAPAPV